MIKQNRIMNLLWNASGQPMDGVLPPMHLALKIRC
jgi:hypothetical protein